MGRNALPCHNQLSYAPASFLQFVSASVRYFLRFHKSFIIYGAGAFLAQKEDNGKLAVLAHFSKRSTSSQQHYSATQKECLAVVLVVTRLGVYIWVANVFVLRITAHFGICIRCKVRRIYLHGGRSCYNRTILRLSTNREDLISLLTPCRVYSTLNIAK